MAILLASYYIDSDDRNVDYVLDSAIWHTLDSYDAESSNSGVWYLLTDATPINIYQHIKDVFDCKKSELKKAGVKNSILNSASFSLCIHRLSGKDWITYNDHDIEQWLKERKIGSPSNIIVV